MPDAQPLLTTELPFPKKRGKVRDVYDLGHDRLAIVATDRISAYDVILPNGIPGKGALLTGISRFWFEKFKDRCPNHLLPGGDPAVPTEFADRTMVVRRTEVVPFECVARGHLAGSGWAEYQQAGRVCGVELPSGLVNGDKLPTPIFTPATKAEEGHDENVSFDAMADAVGGDLAAKLRELTLALYGAAAKYAATRGILIADTKLEFGRLPNGSVLLIDEIFTPDSSRFWPADDYRPGGEQPSFDKQFVRDWLGRQPWDKTPPAPPLPPEVVEGTRQRYAEVHERLTK
jgi:phosphoribosylaminoimidazole-succinocarboxamide synthase